MSSNQEYSVDIGWIRELSFEDAIVEDMRRRTMGQEVVLMALGINGAGSEQLFWSEATGRLQPGDEVGPVIVGRDTVHPAIGIAVWRGLCLSTEKPRCWTNVIPKHKPESSPIPQSLVHDDQVRRAMHIALTLEDDELRRIAKIVANERLQPIHRIELSTPIILPSTSNVGTHNIELKAYAFEAYDALAQYFGSRGEWGEWEITAYYGEGDDMNASVHLGVFTQKVHNQ